MSILSFFLFAVLCAGSLAQPAIVTCSGEVSAPRTAPFKIEGSILVDGTSCSLTNVIINGGVEIRNNGILKTFGATTMRRVSGAGNVSLEGSTAVSGDVTILTTKVSTLAVTDTASITGKLNVDGPVSVMLSSTAALGPVNVTSGSLSMKGGSAQEILTTKASKIEICNTNIMKGVQLLETAGIVSGLVEINGSTFANLEVLMNNGNVDITNVKVTSTLLVTKTKGQVLVDNVDATVQASMTENNGEVTLRRSKGARFFVQRTSSLAPVIIENNSDINLIEVSSSTDNVIIQNNINSNGRINVLRNTAGVVILGNNLGTSNARTTIRYHLASIMLSKRR
eukprot:IDg1708t1